MQNAEYENKYEVTFERFLEWVELAKINSHYKRKTVFWCIMAVVAAACAVFFGIIAKNVAFILFYFFICGFCVYRGFFRLKLLTRGNYSNLLKKQNGKWDRSIIFENTVIVFDGNTKSEFEYSDITGFVRENGWYTLSLPKNMKLRCLEGSFTVGDEKDFEEFIRLNCENLK